MPGGDQFLPLIALLLGMFVTTGETLVFGLAKRVLKGAAALVGSEEEDGKQEGRRKVEEEEKRRQAGGTGQAEKAEAPMREARSQHWRRASHGVRLFVTAILASGCGHLVGTHSIRLLCYCRRAAMRRI